RQGRALPLYQIEAGYFLSILSILSDFFLPSPFFFSIFFLPSFFLSIFFSILSDLSIFLSCATAAKLMAANIAATTTATNCFIVIPFSGCIGKTGLGRSPLPITRLLTIG